MVDDGGERVRARNRRGCANCNFTGIVGRTPCAELLVPDEEFLRLLRDDDELGARNHWHRTGINTDGAGVRVMAHAISKLRRGLVDPGDVEVQIGSIQIAPPHANCDPVARGVSLFSTTAQCVDPSWVQGGASGMSEAQPSRAIGASERRLN